ncbi:hypothetical protein ESB00_17380 [Oleiharenicola lentus]|uniref:Uncharacterized protein n=1 Tax=Oleiharenicola lentus TaxID=2508720 RepID=A0A4Q1C4V0_9BACT|nr:hypothetical protein ESB00_17380 [Oleiharenicola lentus]
MNALLAKLAVSKNSATPAARIKAEKPVKSTPRQRGAKYLVLARESLAEDGNLAEPIELIDQASEALEAAS